MRLDLLSLLPFSLLSVGGPLNSANDLLHEYDYVIVGGGTAGLAVASRLTEDPSTTVIVLEAGTNAENFPEVYIPGLAGSGVAFTSLNWAYQTVPQNNLNGRTAVINAGKVMGGGSILNSMIFPRAEKEQYDFWGELNNDPEWTWETVLPYFRKSENFSRPTAEQMASGVRYDETVHGLDPQIGRVKVGYPNHFFPQSFLWQNASGFLPSPDLANGNPQGTVGIAPDSLDAQNNTRCSSTCAYFTPYAGRPNLKVLTGVFVTRILWKLQDESDPNQLLPLQAEGVEYRAKNNLIQSVSARKEVIVSAGTLSTPKILEHSGVGNATILKKAGVTPVMDLPTVGENLSDHVHGWANSFTNASITRDMLMDPQFKEEQMNLWMQNRSGILSAAPRSLGIAAASDLFTASQLDSVIQETEDSIEYYAREFSNGNEQLMKGIEAQYKFTIQLWKEGKLAPAELNLEPGYSGPTPFPDRPQVKYTTVNAVVFTPFSRGRVHINSSSPFDMPEIDPAYYTHPLDLTLHTNSIQLARKMLRTPPLDSIYMGEFEPGLDKESDADVADWARAVATTDNHVIGTMAMMPKEMGGVVDTHLKIYGIQNVRVVDASIIPMPISAHICSTVYMIAEKAADLIRADALL